MRLDGEASLRRRRGVPISTASTAIGSTAPAGPVRLEVSGLSKSFGPVKAVSELSSRRTRLGHRLPRPQRGRARPRRCGCSSDWCTPTRGTATIDGRPTPSCAAAADRGRGARDRIPPRPPGRDHLRVSAGPPASRFPRRRGAGPGRPGRRRRPQGRGYSLGMRQRLGLASALLGDPASWSSTSPPTAWTPRASSGCATSCATWRRAGPHRPRVQPPARRGGADGGPRGHRRRRSAGAGRLDDQLRWRRRRRHGPGRGPEMGRLADVLSTAGTQREPGRARLLTVTGATPAEVGHHAFAAGIELHELRPHTSGTRGDLLPAHQRLRTVRRPVTRHDRHPGGHPMINTGALGVDETLHHPHVDRSAPRRLRHGGRLRGPVHGPGRAGAERPAGHPRGRDAGVRDTLLSRWPPTPACCC